MLATSHACPCCGQPVTTSFEDAGKYLPKVKARIYDIIRRSMPYGITSEALVERVYNSGDGGPDSGSRIISVHINHMNKILSPFGVRVYSKAHRWHLKLTTEKYQPKPTRQLTPHQIKLIRRDTRSDSVIGREYGVCKQTIQRAQSRKTWAHIP